MMLAMSPSDEAIGRTICDAFDHFAAQRPPHDWKGFLSRLHEQLVVPDPARGVEGLLWVLTHEVNPAYQNLAGEILERVKEPCPCPRPLGPLLDELLPIFNASSNMTVRYLVRSFGQEAVLEAVRGRLREARGAHVHADRAERRRLLEFRSALEAMAYWLGDGTGG